MANSQKARVDVDDDVDDLDDVLEQFSAPSLKPAAAPPSVPPPSKSKAAPSQPQPAHLGLDDLDLDEDFARELTRGMESLMREINGGPEGAPAQKPDDARSQTEEEKAHEQALRAAWGAMLLEGMAGADAGDDASDAKGKAKEGPEAEKEAGGTSHKDDVFQTSIRKAMEKLKESDSNLQADAASNAPDSLEALLSQLGSGLEGEGDSEEELTGILETMMSQLMSKEILYEPLKELHEKFPPYLAENASKITPEDKTRYDVQYVAVTKVLAIFDDPTYSDEDAQKSAQVMELMNEMQNHGSPPAEIMGPMPPGLDLGPDGMPKLPEGCTIS